MRLICIDEPVIVVIPDHMLKGLKKDLSLDDREVVANIIGPKLHELGWNLYEGSKQLFVATSE